MRRRPRSTAAFEGASAAARLAWTLLSLRSDTDWAPYLVALPHSLDTPTSGAWSRKEIAELQVADVIAAAAMTLARDARSVPMIVARRDGVDEKDAAADERLSADWAWALSCVRSRAIELEYPNGATQSFLVPFVDMLNHAHVDPAVAWTSEDAHRRGTSTATVPSPKKRTTKIRSPPKTRNFRRTWARWCSSR